MTVLKRLEQLACVGILVCVSSMVFGQSVPIGPFLKICPGGTYTINGEDYLVDPFPCLVSQNCGVTIDVDLDTEEVTVTALCVTPPA
jgi:type 1 fimbria pilin